ncbi:MAG: hypothetical protein HYX25_04275 [Candidatus Solibacter usitatus]|nr:hypothetical protein [Candidatus Solibacter usitatus]
MNIHQAIKELLAEKERLDRAIAHLEGMQKQRGDAAPEKKRRGRKTMDAQARRQVSERMKRYWEARRKGQPDSQNPGPEPDAKPDS